MPHEATTHEQATAPFVGQLRHKAFMQQHRQPEKPVQAGCLSIPLLRMQRYIFAMAKMVNRIIPAKTMSPTVDGPERQCSTLQPHDDTGSQCFTLQPHDDAGSQCSTLQPHDDTEALSSLRDMGLLLVPINVKAGRIFGDGVISSPISNDILVEGKIISIILSPVSTSSKTHISVFSVSNTAYVWVQQPLELVNLIENLREKLYWTQPSEKGVCAIDEFCYAITDKSAQPSRSICNMAKSVFTVCLRQKCNNATFIHFVQSSWRDPPVWVCRYVWSLFVYARNSLVTYQFSGIEFQGTLVEITPHVEGVKLSLDSGGTIHHIGLRWTDCGDLNSFGFYFDSTMQKVISNLPGWSTTVTEARDRDYRQSTQEDSQVPTIFNGRFRHAKLDV
jgi:hypothetical protein